MKSLSKTEDELMFQVKEMLERFRIPQHDFESLLDGAFVSGPLEIVSEPEGDDNDEQHGVFSEVFVEQWSRGESGDSFAGNIYARLGKLCWLKVPYFC